MIFDFDNHILRGDALRIAVGISRIVNFQPVNKAIFLSIISLLLIGTSAAQDTLVILNSSDSSLMLQNIEYIESMGGNMTHRFPPHILIGDIPSNQISNIKGFMNIVDIITKPIDVSSVSKYGRTAEIAVNVWNNNYMGNAAVNHLSVPANELEPIIGDMLLVPGKDEIRVETSLQSPPYGAGFYDTSEYMIGDVAVGIILLESNGAIDNNSEDWTPAEESIVISQIQTGLNWWKLRESKAKLTFTYNIRKVPTSYEPISRSGPTDFSSGQSLWITDAMTSLGYTRFPDTRYFDNVYDYNNAIRNSLNTDWAYTIFVVDSSNDFDGKFKDGYSAYAYLGGPFIVMTYNNGNYGISNMDYVTAHETGHTFYATDEYNGVTEYSGYLNAFDIENSGFIMHCGLCWGASSGTILQLGWRDTDADDILDIIDFPPSSTLNTYSLDPTNDNTPTYTGRSITTTAYPNTNPHGSKNTSTINKITTVVYSIDGAPWASALPVDGLFNSSKEDFTFTTPILSDGMHTIYVRALNTAGNWETTYATDTLTIDTYPPYVIAHTPIGAVADSQISIKFSEEMNQSTAQLAFSTSPATTGSFGWSGNVMTYDPDQNLNYNSSYIVTLGTGAKDLAGNSLQSPYSWQFTTAMRAAPAIEWTKNIGGNSIKETTDDGYIIVGGELIKTDSSGNVEWKKSISGSEVQQTNDRGYIVTNGTHLVKTDSSGSIEWDRNFSRSDYNSVKFNSVDKTKDGGFILAGEIYNTSDDISNEFPATSLLLKTTSTGIEEWNNTITYNGQISEANSVRQTTDGGYIVVGSQGFSANSGVEAYIIKTDSFGIIMAGNREQLGYYYEGYSGQETTDGGYIYGGGGDGGGDFVIKLDSLLNQQWETNIYRDPGRNTIYSINQTRDKGYIVTSNTFPFVFPEIEAKYSVTKLNSSGAIEWNKVMNNFVRSVQQTKDGGYIVIGSELTKIAADTISPKTISNCTTISSPGVYKLNADVMNYPGTCINITSNNVIFDGAGLKIDGTDADGTYGVYVYNPTSIITNVTVKNLTVTDWSNGIYYKNATRGIITNNKANSNGIGIFVNSSNSNNITNNNISNSSSIGIEVYLNSSNNTISSNKVNNSRFGIFFVYAFNTTASKNIMENNTFNFGVGGNMQSHFEGNNIDTSNLANGRPVYYVKYGKNTIYDGSTKASTFYCILCNNVTVKDLEMSNMDRGVYFWSTGNSRIQNIKVKESGWGVYLRNSSNNTIQDSKLSTNNIGDYSETGVTLYSSDNNTFENNTFILNNYGIELYSSNKNTIYNNYFNNTNNFVFRGTNNNTWNITKRSGKNIIGGSYLGGNFWANPSGKGFSQTCTDSNADGLCDLKYLLNENNSDYLPLKYKSSTGITINSPNGGESWNRGTTRTIRWTSVGSTGTYVKIELLKAGVLNRVIIASTLNDGSHPWPILTTQAPGSDYKVKITSTANATYNDTSDDNFTIPIPSFKIVYPNGGENWTRGTTQTIKWNSTESPGTYVRIELLKPGKANQLIISATLNDGSHLWIIPAAQAPGSDYKVKITSTINASNNDTSDNSFTIPVPSFNVVSPNGGENLIRGTTQIIKWISTENPKGYVKIELLKPGKANQLIISATLNDGTHSWLIPAAQIPGTDYKVKITSTINASNNDTSDNNFIVPDPTINVISPDGTEIWKKGTTQTIRWRSTGNPGAYVRIDLLKAGILNRTIVASTLNDGSHPWFIPLTQAIGTDYKVKITSISNLSYNDIGNNSFSIVS